MCLKEALEGRTVDERIVAAPTDADALNVIADELIGMTGYDQAPERLAAVAFGVARRTNRAPELFEAALDAIAEHGEEVPPELREAVQEGVARVVEKDAEGATA